MILDFASKWLNLFVLIEVLTYNGMKATYMNCIVFELSGTKLAHGIIENKLAACVNQIPG